MNWKCFSFYTLCQTPLSILNKLFLDFEKVKDMFVLIFFIENFVKKAVKLCLRRGKVLLIPLYIDVREII